MSKCISLHGEYSEHELSADDEFVCQLCFAFDEEAAVATVAQLRVENEAIKTVDGEELRVRDARIAELGLAQLDYTYQLPHLSRVMLNGATRFAERLVECATEIRARSGKDENQ